MPCRYSRFSLPFLACRAETPLPFRIVASKNHLRLPALSLPELLPQERKSLEGDPADESEMSITSLRTRQAANARWGRVKASGEQ